MCDFMVWIKINIINRRIWRDDHFLEETLSKAEVFIMDHLCPELVCCRQDPQLSEEKTQLWQNDHMHRFLQAVPL